jgi:hypothetical protein
VGGWCGWSVRGLGNIKDLLRYTGGGGNQTPLLLRVLYKHASCTTTSRACKHDSCACSLGPVGSHVERWKLAATAKPWVTQGSSTWVVALQWRSGVDISRPFRCLLPLLSACQLVSLSGRYRTC